MQHDTSDWAIEGTESIRPDISHTFNSKEAADRVFFEFELPLYQPR